MERSAITALDPLGMPRRNIMNEGEYRSPSTTPPLRVEPHPRHSVAIQKVSPRIIRAHPGPRIGCNFILNHYM